MSRISRAPLGDCCEIVSGATPKTEVDEYWDGDVLWATPKDLSKLSGMYIDSTQRKITEAGLKSCAASILPIGSVLFSSRAPIGHVAINTHPLATNQGFKSFIPKSDRVDAKYLAHWLKENRPYLESLGNGATFKEVSKATIAKVEIPLPSLGEQRRIAQVLDSVDALRAKRRKAIALLDDLAHSIFLDMFGDPLVNPRGWDRARMSDFLLRIDSGKSPQCMDRPASPDEWGILKLGSVTRCVYLPEQNKALPADSKVDERNVVQVGDLLFSRKNTPELVAASAYVRETRGRVLLPDLIFRLVVRDNAPVDKVYLHSLLTYPAKRRKIQELASGSATSMPNISKSKLLGFECEIPPLRLQQTFASRLDALESARLAHLAHLAELDALFASLQHRSFRGELWADNPAA